MLSVCKRCATNRCDCVVHPQQQQGQSILLHLKRTKILSSLSIVMYAPMENLHKQSYHCRLNWLCIWISSQFLVEHRVTERAVLFELMENLPCHYLSMGDFQYASWTFELEHWCWQFCSLCCQVHMLFLCKVTRQVRLPSWFKKMDFHKPALKLFKTIQSCGIISIIHRT